MTVFSLLVVAFVALIALAARRVNMGRVFILIIVAVVAFAAIRASSPEQPNQEGLVARLVRRVKQAVIERVIFPRSPEDQFQSVLEGPQQWQAANDPANIDEPRQLAGDGNYLIDHSQGW